MLIKLALACRKKRIVANMPKTSLICQSSHQNTLKTPPKNLKTPKNTQN
jgi:hypothetical protein